ncbi:MAG: hypothetical protein V7785_20120 [Bermanella sp.]
MNTIKSITKKTLSISTMALLLLSNTASAQTTGVMGLFQSSNSGLPSTISKLEIMAKTQGCALRREGKILGAQGNYDLKDVNGFFFLECESALLQKEGSEALITSLEQTTENLMLVEGPVSQFGEFSLSKSGVNKSYIIKLSDYNNSSPQHRERDVKALGKIAQTRAHHYKTEAFVRITNAHGMARPDEAVVIYYDTPKDGPLFRKNNEDLMEKIGQFNQDHLTQFSYIAALSNR